MEKYTQFSSLELMLEQSGFSIESSEDFLSIPINDLDKVINEKTSFSSWEEMKITATKRLLQMKLSLG
jgi:hypothetical protein